jgi:hypothetical protein
MPIRFREGQGGGIEAKAGRICVERLPDLRIGSFKF